MIKVLQIEKDRGRRARRHRGRKGSSRKPYGLAMKLPLAPPAPFAARNRASSPRRASRCAISRAFCPPNKKGRRMAGGERAGGARPFRLPKVGWKQKEDSRQPRSVHSQDILLQSAGQKSLAGRPVCTADLP